MRPLLAICLSILVQSTWSQQSVEIQLGDWVSYTPGLDRITSTRQLVVQSEAEAKELNRFFKDKRLLVFIDFTNPENYDTYTRDNVTWLYRVKGINGVHAYQDLKQYQVVVTPLGLATVNGNIPMYMVEYRSPGGGKVEACIPPWNRYILFTD